MIPDNASIAMRTNRGCVRARRPARKHVRRLIIAAAALAIAARPVAAASTEPTLALMRATAVHGSAGRATITLEASFSYRDVVQLGLPLDVQITIGSRTAHCALDGTVTVSLDGGPAEPTAAPCVLAVTERAITLVLPAELGSGDAIAQLILTHEGRPIASNRLRFTV
jgi:hypothetical protein